MAKISLSFNSLTVLSVFFLVTFNLVSWSFSASHFDSIYKSFLQCLQNNTTPQDQISKLVFTQSNTSYNSVLTSYIRNSRFNTSTSPKPILIVTPTKISHVQATVICSKRIGNYQLKIRSGGHDYDGISYVSDMPFLMLDMFNLRNVDVDVVNETAWVQSGATLGELYYGIWRKSKVHGFPAGVCPTVCVGGHLSGGGYGNLLRKFGLSVDNVVDAIIVDVNGRVLDRKAMGEDLFWAIRGGGGASFGVIVGYKISLVRVPDVVTVFSVEQRLDEVGNAKLVDFVYKWQLVAPKIDDGLFMRMVLQPVSSRIKKKEKTVRVLVRAMYLGNADNLLRLLNNQFLELGLKKKDCMEKSWIQSVVYWAFNGEKTSPTDLLDRNPNSAFFLKRKSDYVQTPISKEGLDGIFRKMVELGKTGLVFNPYGGKMDEILSSDTPFPHRAGNLFKIQYSVSWGDPGSEAEKEYMTQIRSLHSYMTPFVSKNPRSAYLNYRDVDIGVMQPGKNSLEQGRVYGHKYFNDNFDRLVKIKTAVDPANFFRNEQSIPTLSGTEEYSGVMRDSSTATFLELTGLLTSFLLLNV